MFFASLYIEGHLNRIKEKDRLDGKSSLRYWKMRKKRLKTRKTEKDEKYFIFNRWWCYVFCVFIYRGHLNRIKEKDRLDEKSSLRYLKMRKKHLKTKKTEKDEKYFIFNRWWCYVFCVFIYRRTY